MKKIKRPIKIVLIFNRQPSISKIIIFLFSLFISSTIFSQPLAKGLYYTTCENEYLKDILLLNDRSYLIASDVYASTGRGVLVYKIKLDGSIIWSRKVFGYNDSAKTINELIAKYSNNNTSPDYVLGVGAWNGNIVTGDTIQGMMILKLDSNGNVLGNWSVHSVSGDKCTATGIVSNYSLSSNYFILVGNSQISNGGNGLIACIDAVNAQIIWQKEVSSPGCDLSFLDIKETLPGRFVISGCVNKDSLKRGVLVEMDKNGQFLTPLKHYSYNAFGYKDLALSPILTDEKPGVNSSFAVGGMVYYPSLSNCTDAYIMHLDTGLVVSWGTIYNIGCNEVLTDLFYNHKTSEIMALGFQDDTLYLGYKYPYFVFPVDSAAGGIPDYIKYGFTDPGEEFGTAATYNITNDSLIMAMSSKTNPFVQCNTASTIIVKSTTTDTNLVACEMKGNAINCPTYMLIDSVLTFTIQQNLVMIPLVYQDNSPLLAIDTACKSNTLTVFKSKNKNLQEIDIFPNPSNGETEIVFNHSVNNTHIKIFNLTGQSIYEKTGASGNYLTFDISNQTSGIYFLEIHSEGNIFRKKLIKL